MKEKATKYKRRAATRSADFSAFNISAKNIEVKEIFLLLFVHFFGSSSGQTSFSTDHDTFTFGLTGESWGF